MQGIMGISITTADGHKIYKIEKKINLFFRKSRMLLEKDKEYYC